MGDVGDEIGAQAVELAVGGDVVADGDGPADVPFLVAQWGGQQFNDLGLGRDRSRLGLSEGEGAAYCLVQRL